MTFAIARKDRFPPPWTWTVKVTILFRAHRNLCPTPSLPPFDFVALDEPNEKTENFYGLGKIGYSDLIVFALTRLVHRESIYS